MGKCYEVGYVQGYGLEHPDDDSNDDDFSLCAVSREKRCTSYSKVEVVAGGVRQ